MKQQKWVTKLFGYDYEIIYKKGKENMVVDALSRKYEEERSCSPGMDAKPQNFLPYPTT